LIVPGSSSTVAQRRDCRGSPGDRRGALGRFAPRPGLCRAFPGSGAGCRPAVSSPSARACPRARSASSSRSRRSGSRGGGSWALGYTTKTVGDTPRYEDGKMQSRARRRSSRGGPPPARPATAERLHAGAAPWCCWTSRGRRCRRCVGGLGDRALFSPADVTSPDESARPLRRDARFGACRLSTASAW